MVSPSVPEIGDRPDSVTTRDVSPRRAGSARWKPIAYSVPGPIASSWCGRSPREYTRTEFDLLPGPLEVAQRMGDYIFGDEAENIPPGWVFVNFWDTFRKTLYGFFGASRDRRARSGSSWGGTGMRRTSSSTSSTWRRTSR